MGLCRQRKSGIEHEKAINGSTVTLYNLISNKDLDLYTLVIFADDDVNQQKSCSDGAITLHFILLEQLQLLRFVMKST